MNAKLLSQAGTDLEGMLLTLPLSFARYHSGKGYAVYGADARAVVQSLLLWTQNDFDSLAARGRRIRRTFNALLGLRRVGDARNALGNCIRQAKLEHQLQVNGQPVPVSKEGRVNADYSQDKSNGGFHVWQVKRAGEGYDFTDADQAYANCLGTTAGEQTSSRHIVASVRGNPQDVN